MTIDELLDQAERAFFEGGDHQPSLVLTDANGMPIFAGYLDLSDWVNHVSLAMAGMQRTCPEATHATFTFPAAYHLVPAQTVMAFRGQAIPVDGPGTNILILGVVTLGDELAIEYRCLDKDRQPVPGVELGKDDDDPILVRVRKFRAIYPPQLEASFEAMVGTLTHDRILEAGMIFER